VAKRWPSIVDLIEYLISQITQGEPAVWKNSNSWRNL